MSSWRGLWRWAAMTMMAAGLPAALQAQGLDEALRDVDNEAGFFARNPRLLAMGRIRAAVRDVHNRISLWELGNPGGLLAGDSTSIFEVAIGSASQRSEYDLAPTTRVRQDAANGALSLPLEAWSRSERTAYGFQGRLGTLQTDRTYDEDVERRTRFTSPYLAPTLNSVLPLIRNPRLRYALRLDYAPETIERNFRLITKNGAGDFVNQDGTIIPAPDTFIPLEAEVDVLGGGAWLSYGWDVLGAALGYERLNYDFFGTNEGPRHRAELTEERPYNMWQGTLAGRVGAFEWGVDGRSWSAESEQQWVYSVSAGTAVPPLAGRGRMLTRTEEGSAGELRARWRSGALEIGVSGIGEAREIDQVAPAIEDKTSFNYFRNRVYNTPGADTLSLPDSVTSQRTEEQSWAGAVGASWTFKRALLAVEGRRDFRERDNSLSNVGPRVEGWDIRSGIEYQATDRLALRGGYGYRWEDGDENTQQTEFRGFELTAGLGITAANGRWGLDLAFGHGWAFADYGTPQVPRGVGQRFTTRVRWAL